VGVKSAVERHHLYPKGYLASLGITNQRETNQIANYAYLEYNDNIKISNRAPEEYIQDYEKDFDGNLLKRMYHWHALPKDWEHMEYSHFLEKRRELMAQIIREGYKKLISREVATTEQKQLSLMEIISLGETHQVEFKATLRTNLHTNARDHRMEYTVLRTIAGFLNTNGGMLTIGVFDDGTPVGLEVDGFENEDKMALHLTSLVKSNLNILAMPYIHIHFDDYMDTRVMVVECKRSSKPIFLKDGKEQRFFIRTGPSTTELKADEILEYTKIRFS
jgi:Asp-tRNA(Asn)/Glu-tRNA(Gln) amidotransferase A subunit family amidase